MVREELLASITLFIDRFLDVNRDVNNVLNIEIGTEHGRRASLVFCAEEVSDHKSGALDHLVRDVWSLILLIRLAE